MRTADLTTELCKHLRDTGFFCATEVPLTRKGAFGWNQRADVYAIKLHEFAKKDTRIYEIKTSRADFLKDVDAGKAEAYGEHARRVYYVVPQGLIKKSEVPDGIGLMVFYETSGFKVLQAPKPGPMVEPNSDLLLMLMARWSHVEPDMRRLANRIAVEENLELADKAKSIGYDISLKLRRGGLSQREKVAVKLLDGVELAMGRSAARDPVKRARSNYELEIRLESLVDTAVRMIAEAQRIAAVGDYLKALSGYSFAGSLDKTSKKVDQKIPRRKV